MAAQRVVEMVEGERCTARFFAALEHWPGLQTTKFKLYISITKSVNQSINLGLLY
jgi:hypothetical protein